MVRHSLNYVSWKTRKEVAAALKSVYACATVEQASQALDEFETVWGKDFPKLAAQLATHDSILWLSARDS